MREKLRYKIESWVSKLLWLRYRNRPYIEFYRAVMKYHTATNPKDATGGGDWEKSATHQFERLKRYGLTPDSTLFELGCGQLRGGRLMIDYLNPGNYSGNDISPDIIVEAKKVLREEGLEDKDVSLFVTNDLSFSEVSGKTFDFIHAQSVLSHMPPEDVEELFKNLSNIMHAGSVFLASFFVSKDDTIYPFVDYKNFAFPMNWIEEKCQTHGLVATFDEPQMKQKLMCIKKAS